MFIYVSFNVGWGCFAIGDNGGNDSGVCVVVSLLEWWPNIVLEEGWCILLSVILCLSPDVVCLIGVGGGVGVGSLAGVAHCEFWRSDDVEGEGGGSAAEAIHSD